MILEFIPLLQIQRDLYDIPRGITRFNDYLKTLTGGTDDMVLPLAAMNPMAKAHVPAQLDALMALGAEEVAAEAVVEAQQRLLYVQEEIKIKEKIKVALVIADDAHGGWTNRYLTETRHFFQNKGEARRNWATVLLWTGTRYTTQEPIRQEVLSTIYRILYLKQHGLPNTLRQMMRQEGVAMAFAGATEPAVDPEELAYTREVIEPYLDSKHFPTVFACLYGDDAAISVGYEPQGLSARAGYAVALADALQYDITPKMALSEKPFFS